MTPPGISFPPIASRRIAESVLSDFSDLPGVAKASIRQNVVAHKFTPANDFRGLTALLRNFVTPKPSSGLVLRSVEGASRRTFQRARPVPPSGSPFDTLALRAAQDEADG
jgi:hypothetical protein